MPSSGEEGEYDEEHCIDFLDILLDATTDEGGKLTLEDVRSEVRSNPQTQAQLKRRKSNNCIEYCTNYGLLAGRHVYVRGPRHDRFWADLGNLSHCQPS